jgi:dienelactone hydrolase
MQKTFTLLLALFCSAAALSAQNPLPFTEKNYGWRIEKDLEYGIATNYAGISTTLLLDLYKPVGDNNYQRPLIVLVHGGAWLGGCKDDPNSGIVAIAKEMAQRGYVVASVNYRLGWHKSGTPIANPFADGQAGATLYAADSSEIIRALYRGQQDVKGAIRWLKARAALDSTCSERILVGGESAGGFLALATGFLDRPEEKPASCFALPAAPPPAANVTNSYSLNCGLEIIQPAGTDLLRPDLGPIDGTLNLNGHDANVRGIINLFGGVPFDAGAGDWLQGPDTPSVYLYHQTCDGVVPFGGGYPFFIISNYCNLGFTPWHYNYPVMFGSGTVAAVFESAGPGMHYITDFEQCPPFNSDLALLECIRYGQNGSYHFTSNVPLRAQKIADFFSPVISADLCFSLENHEPAQTLQARIAPNPFNDQLSVFFDNAPAGNTLVWLTDFSGKMLWSESRAWRTGNHEIALPAQLPSGIYLLQIRSSSGTGAWKVVKR